MSRYMSMVYLLYSIFIDNLQTLEQGYLLLVQTMNYLYKTIQYTIDYLYQEQTSY